MSISSAPKSKGFKLSRKSAQANDPYDPYSGIEFSPDKDSDELFECLKRYFPAGKTHKERMKLALMDFIINEQKEKNPRRKKPMTAQERIEYQITGAKGACVCCKEKKRKVRLFPLFEINC